MYTQFAGQIDMIDKTFFSFMTFLQYYVSSELLGVKGPLEVNAPANCFA